MSLVSYAILDGQGVVIGTGKALTLADAERSCDGLGVCCPLRQGQEVIEGVHYLKEGEFKELPERPGVWAVFDCEAETWLDPRTEEETLAPIRMLRDQLLAACDWTQLPDADLTEEELQAWRVYRQALRDITETNVWPEEPKK